MFGWGENREDGKHRKENRIENSVFHCLAKEGKWGGKKIREKIISPEPTIFILPNREENLREKCCGSTFTQIPSPNVYNNPARQKK